MMTDSAPVVSIIVAVHNGARTLQQCIDSVVRQTYPNRELIIIDGGSDDGTAAILRSNSDVIFYSVSEADRGIYNAWNKGLLQSNGDWICFLGADDYFWDERVLENMIAQMETMPADVRVAYGQVMSLSGAGEKPHLTGEPWERVQARFKQLMCIPHPGTLHRRSLFEQHGGFDESFRIAGDYEFLLRELKDAPAFHIREVITAGMRMGGISSSTPANMLAALVESRRAQRKHHLDRPGWHWLMALARAYARSGLWAILGEAKARRVLDFRRKLMRLPPAWTRM